MDLEEFAISKIFIVIQLQLTVQLAQQWIWTAELFHYHTTLMALVNSGPTVIKLWSMWRELCIISIIII